MAKDGKKYWFPADAPLSLEGWACLVIWLVAFTNLQLYLKAHNYSFPVRFGLALVMVALAFVFLYFKGDPERYRRWWKDS
jgi:hypothetical protein